MNICPMRVCKANFFLRDVLTWLNFISAVWISLRSKALQKEGRFIGPLIDNLKKQLCKDTNT